MSLNVYSFLWILLNGEGSGPKGTRVDPTRPPGAAPNPGNTHPNPRAMTATTIALLLALLLLPLLVLLWATESTEQRTKRLNSYGWSQRRIADHLHITRYRVRMALAS